MNLPSRLVLLQPILIFVSSLSFGQIDSNLRQDDPVLVALDSMWCERLSSSLDSVSDTVFEQTAIHYPDSVHKKWIFALDQHTPISLAYNAEVINFINVYSKKYRKHLCKMLARSPQYFNLFEEELERQQMPLELKYLPVVESALNPQARSRMGAGGLWQLMPGTAKLYGVKIGSYVDERFDPQISTEAGVRYLRFLHRMYKDWLLAIAAYNCGPGNLNKAMRRSGKKTYWEIRPYLPRETRSYVPAFIAVYYTLEHADKFQLRPDTSFAAIQIDTVHVSQRVDLKIAAKHLQVDTEVLAQVNPMYKLNIVPDIKESMAISLPITTVGAFLLHEDSIYSQSALKYDEKEIEVKAVTHTVRRGECLGVIADKYGCRVSDLKRWNNLRSDRLRTGRRLHVREYYGSTASSRPSKTKRKQTSGDKYYRVRRGDTLWDIARKYPGISTRDILKLNPSLNAKRLKPGKRIKIN